MRWFAMLQVASFVNLCAYRQRRQVFCMHDGTMNVLGIVLIDCVYFGIVLAAVSREKSATQIQTEMQLHAYGIRDTYDRVYIYI